MKKLLETTTLGGIEVSNRLVRSATWENMADEHGYPTEKLENLYTDFASGGIGMIITGFARVMEDDLAAPRMIGMYDDCFIDSYQKLTEKVRAEGAKIAVQLAGGSSQSKFRARKRRVLGPSAVQDKMYRVTPEEMTCEDIKKVENAFAQACLRAKKSGFDAVQLHCAHGYLFSKFLSPYYNRRSDSYGGAVKNRARIIYETYEQARELCGDFPIFIKINCDDFNGEDPGLTFEESLSVCSRLSEKGLDAIEVSGAMAGSPERLRPIRPIRGKEDESYFFTEAAKTAGAVESDVISVGGHRDFEWMQKALNETEVGFFAMSRPFTCEHDLVKRWSKYPNYRPMCISCNKCWSAHGTRCILTESGR
ncbi:NADH:flavin oxidoreductase [Sedimentisphaera salicampi]|uniref:NADPH dehydrogenase n=1 Tax=Sedimentisphaera salicampi TaxID=1941349 RepID=A0A1W6LQG7_9BACT|nr:NADH:flavin oxidoreductase [Sedimentisphaera salicampi]ARN57973.1 NADPH dehydrogenase [Sedimentisphaera salicampi]